MRDPEVSSISEIIKSMEQREMITKMGIDRLDAIKANELRDKEMDLKKKDKQN